MALTVATVATSRAAERTLQTLQGRADRAFSNGMRDWYRQLISAEGRSVALHRRIGAAMRESLQRGGLRPGEARRRVAAVMRRFEAARVNLVEETIVAGARHGASMRGTLARAMFGDAGAQAQLQPNFNVSRLERRVAVQRANGEFALDRLGVSQRLARHSARTVQQLSTHVEQAVRLGESATQLSQRVLAASDVSVAIPRYISDMADLARNSPPNEVRSAVQRELSRLRAGRIVEHDISRSTRRFLRQLETAQGTEIDHAVNTWVEERAQNQAMTVARTEAMNAQAQSFVESVTDEEWCVGFRWNLNPGHAKPDVCDMMAGQDLHGLGPGGYPKGGVPALAHPNDLCFFTAIIDDNHIARQRAQRNGTAEPPKPWATEGGVSGADWLRQQPAETRTAVLGPGRAREFDRGGRRGARVVNADGSLNPLYHVQNRPAPPRPEQAIVVRRAGVPANLTTPPPAPRARRTRGGT